MKKSPGFPTKCFVCVFFGGGLENVGKSTGVCPECEHTVLWVLELSIGKW